MGLTVHWKFRAPANMTPEGIKAICEKMRQHALTLPFEQVDDKLIERIGTHDCNFENFRVQKGEVETEEQANLGWLLIQASEYLRVPGPRGEKGTHYSFGVTPIHIIGFSTWPAPGCESMNISFAKFPETIERYHNGKHRTYKTRKQGWTGRGFCKTQYANEYGIPNFLRAHGCVISMLDKAKELDILKYVSDEGNYWTKRNAKELVKEIGEWDNMIAAFAGSLKDAVEGHGAELVAPILERQDFEHLEMEGRMKSKNLPKFLQMIKGLVKSPAGEKTGE